MGDGCAGRDDVAGLEVVAPVTLLVLEAPPHSKTATTSSPYKKDW